MTTGPNTAGRARLNGIPGFAFLLSASDGDVRKVKAADLLRIRIWDIVTGETVYDNLPGSADTAPLTTVNAIGGGDISIHK